MWLVFQRKRVQSNYYSYLLTTLLLTNYFIFYKAIFVWYRRKQRGDRPYTAEEESSCVMNNFPGVSDLTLLSFKGFFYFVLI